MAKSCISEFHILYCHGYELERKPQPIIFG